MSKVTIIDNVLPKRVHTWLHKLLIMEPVWNLNMFSNEENHRIAGRILYCKYQNINSKTPAQALCAMTYFLLREKTKFLSEEVIRIHLGAKAPLQDDKFHTDGSEDETTVLYYLNDKWDKSWGGHTIVDDVKVEYKPNRAVIYSAATPHKGQAGTASHFRSYINYVVKGNYAKDIKKIQI